MARKSLCDWCIENAREELLEQWDYEKNAPFTPELCTPAAGKKVWWKCDKGHSWEAVVSSRTKAGSGCPYCSGHSVLQGFNDLATTHNDLILEWDYDSNDGFPTMFTAGSKKKVWWKCHICGHQWQTAIYSRASGTGCPDCGRRKNVVSRQIPKEGQSLAERYPDIAAEWHPVKNLELSPQQVHAGSERVVWWKCDTGHEYQMDIYSRTKAQKCPICSNKRVLQGYNDLGTTHPELAKEWHREKNGRLLPSQITYGSNKKVWWKCSLGHEWEVTIASRATGNKSGCPICSGNIVLAGFNDLATTHPEIAKEWSPKNQLLPTQVSKGSGFKAIWICEKQHEYEASVQSRTNMHSGCPICTKELQTSFPEKTICYYLKKRFPNLIEGYRPSWIEKSEIDIFIPEINLAVEYDGGAWHTKPEKDLLKDRLCHTRGINLIRVRDYVCCYLENTTSIQIFLANKGWEELRKSICQIFSLINQKWVSVECPDIDIERDKSDIYELMDIMEKRNSLAVRHPALAKEWDVEKNGYLTAEMITEHVGKKVWWRCQFGHSWQATVASRVDKKIGCPYCSGRFAIVGETDLATTHPEIAKEWHPAKNGSLTPQDVKAGTNKKVWWQCHLGHEYEAPPAARTNSNRPAGCPFCSGKRVLSGFNDLQTKYPEIAKQWNYERNGEFKPTEVTPKSDKKAWWICSKGHEWQAQIKHRTNGTGCPICFKERRKRNKS